MAAQGNVTTKPQAGNILQVKLVSGQSQQMAYNIFHYRVGTLTTGGATNGEIVTALSTKFKTPLRPLLNPSAFFVGIDLKDLTAILDRSAWSIDDAGLGTGSASDPLPMQVCGHISKYTLIGGRGFRGRFYVPFPGEADNDASHLPIAAYIVKLNALAAALVDTPTIVGATGSTPLQPVIYHRGSGNSDDITDCRSRAYWTTQRRRGQIGQQNADPFR